MKCPKCGSENTVRYPHCDPFGDDTGSDIHCRDCGHEEKVKGGLLRKWTDDSKDEPDHDSEEDAEAEMHEEKVGGEKDEK